MVCSYDGGVSSCYALTGSFCFDFLFALLSFTWNYFRALKNKPVFIGAQLICDVVLVSSVQQSESIIHTHSFLRFLSHIDHYRILSRVPCALQ